METSDESLRQLPIAVGCIDLMPARSRETVVSVQPFITQPDGENVILGIPDTQVFLVVPPAAIELLERFAEGQSVGEVADFYEQKYGETLDMDDFLDSLEAKGVLRPLTGDGDSRLAARSRPSAGPQVRYHFGNFRQAVARRIVSRPVIAGCLILMGAASLAMVQDHSLAARATDLFFPKNRALTWIILTVLTYAAVWLHEMAHLVAARAAGVSSRMGISHRLWYLVAETDLTGLWGVPKRRRYLPFLAGMLLDVTSAALLILLLYAGKHHWLELSASATILVRALVLSYWLRVAWQFFLFVRTDIYFVTANFFDCRNLLHDTEDYLRNLMAKIIPRVRTVDQSGIPAAEQRVIHAYALIWLSGRIFALSTLFAVTIPVLMRYLRDLEAAFKAGYSANRYNFIDSAVICVIFLAPLLAGFALWVNSLLRLPKK